MSIHICKNYRNSQHTNSFVILIVNSTKVTWHEKLFDDDGKPLLNSLLEPNSYQEKPLFSMDQGPPSYSDDKNPGLLRSWVDTCQVKKLYKLRSTVYNININQQGIS